MAKMTSPPSGFSFAPLPPATPPLPQLHTLSTLLTMAATPQATAPSLARLVLDAAKLESAKGHIGSPDPTRPMGRGSTSFPTLARMTPKSPRRQSTSDSRPTLPTRRQSATMFTSFSSHGYESDDQLYRKAIGKQSLAKVAERRASGVDGRKFVESPDEDASDSSDGELRGPFSIAGETIKANKNKVSKQNSNVSNDTDAGPKPAVRRRVTFSRIDTDRTQTDPPASATAATFGHGNDTSQPPPGLSRGWSTLKARLSVSAPSETRGKVKSEEARLTGHELTTELTTGLLPILMLKMSMDRDEHGQHRIPILMNYIKLRVTDSTHAMSAPHAVFRIELEYGDRLLRWVIHRELRDFINLHASYKAANLVNRATKDVVIPPFPKTSVPFLNLLKKDGKSVSPQEFARLQRQELEDYLLKLVKATMFKPDANRLCKFLEISALSVSLATKGGFQGKQGYLRIMSSGISRASKSGFHPLDWKERREPKWFIVRESYLVSVEEPDQYTVFDVFLVDDQFAIQRPTRILKQGIHLLDRFDTVDKDKEKEDKVHDPTGTEVTGSSGAPRDRNHGKKKTIKVGSVEEQWTTSLAAADPNALRNTSSHTFYIINAERKVKVVAKSERQMEQFIASIEAMVAKSIWAGENRFGSFAPIRMNVAAQWLIDGRDYYWNLSRAILLAKERIYIHDWWLSPELYLRRPPALNQKWRLDRLLKRKADEGVHIFVIVYKEVSNGFTPVDSLYTKNKLLSLSPNIHIQRSPSHTGTGNLLWSHHEKMCVIDETIAFMGGLDLCFGRWDSPGHTLIDDASGGMDIIEGFKSEGLEEHHVTEQLQRMQLWPGKDYSNQRVSDFFKLHQPEEDMYDRNKTPRQPWHDIGLQLIGQPARDLCRHFVQRWNYLLRTKNHTRLMPFLLPPADFLPRQLNELGIVGTCEAQICRSCGPWSIGTPDKVEHSIQTAYIKAIQLSDHFVYIENQFFITSCTIEGTTVTNQIGDALVNRAIRAHAEGTPWRAMVVMPTMPGYPSPLNEDGAGSVRLIMDCQYRSICRGDTSIYGRLRAAGLQPEEYVTFFSLRGWGKLKTGQLTTEGIYIHAKAMVVDDRIVIIGSANINERSQRGDRDSELACMIRDTDMIDGVMGGRPYKVGRFAHTMRVRLMREHLGVDVDALEAEEGNMDMLERRPETKATSGQEDEPWDPDSEQRVGDSVVEKKRHRSRATEFAGEVATGVKSVVGGTGQVIAIGGQKAVEDIGKTGAIAAKLFVSKDKGDEPLRSDDPHDGYPDGHADTDAEKLVTGEMKQKGFASTLVPTLEEKTLAEHRPLQGGQERLGKQEGLDKYTVSTQPPDASRSQAPTDSNDSSKTNDGKLVNGDVQQDVLAAAVVPSQTENNLTQSGPEAGRQQQVTKQDASQSDPQPTKSEGAGKNEATPEASQSAESQVPTKPNQAPSDNIEKALGGKVTQDTKEISDVRLLDPFADAQTQGVTDDEYETADEADEAAVQSPKIARRRNPPAPLKPIQVPPEKSLPQGQDEMYANNNVYAKTIRQNVTNTKLSPFALPTEAPDIDPKGFVDPISDQFFKDVWLTVAARNTQIYRKVFRCVPDDNVTTWQGYKEYQNWENRHTKNLRDESSDTGPLGEGQALHNEMVKPAEMAVHDSKEHGHSFHGHHQQQHDKHPQQGQPQQGHGHGHGHGLGLGHGHGHGLGLGHGLGHGLLSHHKQEASGASDDSASATGGGHRVHKKSVSRAQKHAEDNGFTVHERDQMEEALNEVRGHLIMFPTRFMEAEDLNGNFLFSKDRLPPLAIYD